MIVHYVGEDTLSPIYGSVWVNATVLPRFKKLWMTQALLSAVLAGPVLQGGEQRLLY